MQALAAGALYFAVVFAAGFGLGVLRTVVLMPRVGALVAVLVELPIILGIAWVACSRILRHRRLSCGGACIMGASAFVLLMAAEAGVSTLLAGRSLSAHLALYAEPPHLLGLAGQVVFALLPLVQVRRRMGESTPDPPG